MKRNQVLLQCCLYYLWIKIRHITAVTLYCCWCVYFLRIKIRYNTTHILTKLLAMYGLFSKRSAVTRRFYYLWIKRRHTTSLVTLIKLLPMSQDKVQHFPYWQNCWRCKVCLRKSTATCRFCSLWIKKDIQHNSYYGETVLLPVCLFSMSQDKVQRYWCWQNCWH